MSQPLFVAELTINHLGMLNIAKRMILSAKNIGADYVKLKMKKVDKYYSDSMPDWRNFPFKDYRSSLELGKDDFRELDRYCKEIDMPWFSTIHDEDSLEFIKSFNPPMYKIASMDISKVDLLERVISLCKAEHKPIVLSVGGRSISEIMTLVERIAEADIVAYILHTVSIYPTPEGKSNINFMRHLKFEVEQMYPKIKIGYSGHEEGYGPSILAAVYGASMIERHFTLSKDYQIHHIDAAITPTEYRELISLVRQISSEMTNDLVDIDQEELHFLRDMKYSKIQRG